MGFERLLGVHVMLIEFDWQVSNLPQTSDVRLLKSCMHRKALGRDI